jgi:CHAT domain-containing protein
MEYEKMAKLSKEKQQERKINTRKLAEKAYRARIAEQAKVDELRMIADANLRHRKTFADAQIQLQQQRNERARQYLRDAKNRLMLAPQ